MTNSDSFDSAQNPPLLMTGEPDSFAYRTMTTRIPEIIDNILADFGDRYPGDTKQVLLDLKAEILDNRLVRSPERNTPEGESWIDAWRPYQGRRWFELPWYFAEALFYRRLLETTGYFGNDAWAGVDPFHPRKQAELHRDTPWLILVAALKHSQTNSGHSFRVLLHYAVWGNRLDLSYSQVANATGEEIRVEKEAANLLVDDTGRVWNHLQSRANSRLDLICDNSGAELLMDLALADFLLRFRWAAQITLHVKAHPTYVSDTTAADVDITLAALGTKEMADLQGLSSRLDRFRQEGRLLVRADSFWNSSLFFREMPPPVRAELGQAELVIIKGDANYRRVAGDRRWPTTLPLDRLASDFPAPLVMLRTMKSDPIVGLQPDQAERLDRIDPEWRFNGRRGVVQALLR